jgi:leucyl aminopeptidase
VPMLSQYLLDLAEQVEVDEHDHHHEA